MHRSYSKAELMQGKFPKFHILMTNFSAAFTAKKKLVGKKAKATAGNAKDNHEKFRELQAIIIYNVARRIDIMVPGKIDLSEPEPEMCATPEGAISDMGAYFGEV